jgi:hypothetical protein
MANFNINSANAITASTLTASNISTSTMVTQQSTITQNLFVNSGAISLLDSSGTHILESINGDLFFDTELLAKANDIQNIADWALYPALSTINVATNNITVAQKIQTVQLTNASGTFGTSGQYLTSDGTTINWVTPTTPVDNTSNWATFPAVADVNMGLSSITSTNTMTFVIPGSTTTLAGGAGGTLLVNGTPISTGPGNASQWATFPAVADVSVPDFNLTLTSAVPNPNLVTPYKTATVKGNLTVGDTTQTGVRPDFNAYVGSFNVGGGGSPATAISMNSVGTLTLNSLANLSLTSATTTITSGLVSVVGVGGVAITGGGDVAVTGGAVQVSGTVGVAVTGGGGVAVSGGGAVTVTGGVGVSVLGGGGVAVTGGGGVSVVGGAGVLINSGGSLQTETITNVSGTGNTLAINNLSTINGVAYPPVGSGVTSLNTQSGAVTITSPTANLVVGSTGAGNIELTVPGGALSSFLSLYSIFVAPNGNNTTGTGSANNPYLTIARAITARALISNTIEVAIQLFPGTYTENPTLTKNTYLVGVPTGEAKQPVNVNGLITLNDATATAGTIGISNLDVQGAVTASTNTNGTAVFSIFATNIFPVSPVAGNSAVSLTNGTMYITETRITGGTSLANALVINSLGGLFMRDVVIDGSTSATGLTSNTNTITSLRHCFFTSSYAGTAANPLIKFGGPSGAAVQTVEIFDCKFVYTSSTTDTVGNKCCIQMAGTTGTQNLEIVGCLLLCEGAITGSGGQIQCIQKINAGTCNCKYGNLLAGATANHISPAISKIQFSSVP